MGAQDRRLIKVDLTDAIIKATDENGGERLRLAVKIEGHTVLVRFPVHDDWDFYVQDLAKLMVILAATAGDIELDGEAIPEKYWPKWAYVVSQVIKYKECKELIDKIFFDYLRPEVEGLESDDHKTWLRKHMGMDCLFYMFQSILHLEDWFKKKAVEVIQTTFPNLMPRLSTGTSQKSSMFPSTISAPGPAFEFGSPS